MTDSSDTTHLSKRGSSIPGNEKTAGPAVSSTSSAKDLDSAQLETELEMDTAFVFPKDPKPIPEDFVNAVKAKLEGIPEQEKIASAILEADLYSKDLGRDTASR